MLNKFFGVLVVSVTLLCGSISLTSTAYAQQQGEVPGQSLGISSDSDLWRFVRTGNAGSTQMKDELAAVTVPFFLNAGLKVGILEISALYGCSSLLIIIST